LTFHPAVTRLLTKSAVPDALLKIDLLNGVLLFQRRDGVLHFRGAEPGHLADSRSRGCGLARRGVAVDGVQDRGLLALGLLAVFVSFAGFALSGLIVRPFAPRLHRPFPLAAGEVLVTDPLFNVERPQPAVPSAAADAAPEVVDADALIPLAT